MPIPTPKSAAERFFDSDLPYDLLTAIAGLGAGAAGAYRFFTTDPATDPNAINWAWGLAIGVGVALVGQLGKTVIKYRHDASKKSLHDLAGCLHTLNAILAGAFDEKKLGLRSTVWVPSADKQELIQALDYVGDQRKKNKAGRKSPATIGAIGKAFREKIPSGASRPNENYDEFLAFMMENYGFTEEQARDLDPSTMSWVAVPLKNSDKEVVAVLYVDCKVKDYLDADKLALIGLAVIGIAYFVGLRYS